MKKRKISFGTILFLLLVIQFLPGCMMIGFRDEYDSLNSQRQESGDFIPYLYVRNNTKKIPLILFRIDIDKLPHSFVMIQCGQSAANTSEGFESFILDELYIEYEDGSRVDCIEPDSPLEGRTFPVSNQTHTFDGVITKRMGFTLHTKGKAIKSNGEVVPFKRTTKYKYDKDATFHTIFDEWAAC